MAGRFAFWWWPVMALTSPLLGPFLAARNAGFKKGIIQAEKDNRERLSRAVALDLPELEHLSITPLVEWEAKEGFKRDSGVSLWLKSEKGSLLFDVGFGPETPALAENASRLGFGLNQVEGLVISHLHPDHMGGMKAVRQGQVLLPGELGDPKGLPCWLPGPARASGFSPRVVQGPELLPAGLATSGPLARQLFFFGRTEEQALLARLKGKGLVVITGCGHPGLATILSMARALCPDPLYAVVGGLHFPLTQARLVKSGLQTQMIFGTGKPPWRAIDENDLQEGVETIGRAGVQRLLLSAHDTCDHALARLAGAVGGRAQILTVGETHTL